MRKYYLLLLLTVFCSSAVADGYYPNNSVFPVLNSVTNEPEFTVASIGASYDYLGKTIYTSDIVRICMFGKMTTYDIKYSSDWGTFMSFSYVARTMSRISGEWIQSSEATQFVFHPGGLPDEDYSDSDTPLSIPMYAITYSETKGLNLIDLEGLKLVTKLGEGGDIKKYAYVTVFAGADRNSPDIIVVAGKNNYEVYGTFVENGKSGVRPIGDVNGDGVVDAADVVKVTNIIMGK